MKDFSIYLEELKNENKNKMFKVGEDEFCPPSKIPMKAILLLVEEKEYKTNDPEMLYILESVLGAENLQKLVDKNLTQNQIFNIMNWVLYGEQIGDEQKEELIPSNIGPI